MANRYWSPAAAANWGDADVWATTAGGSPTGIATPTSADDVFFTVTNVNNCNIAAAADCQDATFTGYTGTLTHNASLTWSIYGSLLFVSGMGYSANQLNSLTQFLATSARTITSGGKSISQPSFNGVGGKWTLQDNWTASSFTTMTLVEGELDTNGFALTLPNFVTGNNSLSKIITLGASTITCSGTTFAWFLQGSNITVNANTSTIVLSSAAPVFVGAGKTYNNVSATALAGNCAISGINTFNTLTLASTTSLLGRATFAANQTITTFAPSGNSTQNRLPILSSSYGATRTLTVTNTPSAANNTDWQDITITAVTLSGTSVGDCLGNSGITFTTATTRYWVAFSGGNWFDTSSWSETSGGASGATVPLAQDNVIIDALSITSASRTLQMQTGQFAVGKDLTMSAVLNTPTLQTVANAFYGNIILGTMNTGGSIGLILAGRGSQTFTRNAATMSIPISIRSHGGTYTLQDTYTSTGAWSCVTGTTNTGNFAMTVSNYQNTSILVGVTNAPITTLGSSTSFNNLSGCGQCGEGITACKVAYRKPAGCCRSKRSPDRALSR